MKALGGLLNCCTQSIAPGETNGKWWETVATRMRERWSRFAQCDTDEEEEGSHANMLEGAGNASLNEGFTSPIESLIGGGSPLECGSPPSMREIQDEFKDFARTEIRPRLSWYCDEDEFDLAAAKEIGNCYYLGDYCQSSILGVCIDKRQRHCCFNSPMTKMIRAHLHERNIVSMGTAKQPRCGGISLQQMASLDLSQLDTEDLEGRMVSSGIIPDWASFGTNPNINLEDLFTGSGSLIGNEGRLPVSERTDARLSGTEAGAARETISDSVEPLLPEETTGYLMTAGEVSFTQGYVVEKRGNRYRDIDIEVTRSGGEGAVSVRIDPTGPNAPRAGGFDIYLAPQRLYWGHGDRTSRFVRVRLYKDSTWVPAGRTEPDQTEQVHFQFTLSEPVGGVEISPIANMEFVVQPRMCLSPRTGEIEPC